MNNIKFIIWGAGDRGNRIFYHIGKDNVIAFIDSNKEKIGSLYNGKRIISYEQYKLCYKDTFIVISSHEDEIEEVLKKDEIYTYFFMSNLPEDFQTPNPKNIYKEAILKQFKINNRYLIVGNSLLSILLYEWAYEKGIRDISISLDEDGTGKKEEIICDSGFNVYKNDDIEDKIYDVIYLTTENVNGNIRNKDTVKKIYNYSETEGLYQNRELIKFKNKHLGESCFIIGTGPSLRFDDLECLKEKNIKCFSMNNIFRIYDKTNWRPDYYVTSDYRMVRDNSIDFLVNKMKNTTCFISDNYDLMDYNTNVIVYHHGQLWEEKKLIPFSEDCSKIVYTGGTVTYAAMQFAVYMGFKRIYLLGVDATGINGTDIKYKHFYDEKELEATCYSKQVRIAYYSAKKYAESHDIEILNATRGGELEIYKRVDFDKVINSN